MAWLILSAGCATVVPIDGANDYRLPLIEKRQRMAFADERAGDYRGAAMHWQVLKTMDPFNHDYDRQLKRLNGVIRGEVARHFERAEQLLAEGQRQRAALHLMKVLALDERHAGARRVLREMERQRMLRLHAARVQKMMIAAQAEQRPGMAGTTAAVPDIGDELSATHGGQDACAGQTGERSAPAGRSHDTRQAASRAALSENYYKKGVRVYRQDLEKAMAYWSLSLQCNPAHHNARLRMEAVLRKQNEAGERSP